MKTLKTLATLGLLAALFSLSAFGQTVTLTTTTTSAAVASTDKYVCLTSATGVSVPGVGTLGSTLVIGSGAATESMVVRKVNAQSATCFDVTRSNRPVGLASGATVYIGAAQNFYAYDPMGTCTLASMAVRPWINTTTGNISDCLSSAWTLIGGPAIRGTTAQWCGVTNSCAATAVSNSLKVVAGQTAALNAASPSVAAVTGISPAFTSTTSFSCTATAQGTAASTMAVVASNISTSAVTFTGANGSSAVVNYICVGY
jgi:hypothetical protein